MSSRVRAIRWLTFEQNYNTGPESLNLNRMRDEELIPLCLGWERSPDREVSCEIIRWKSRTSFCLGYGMIGLEVDQSSTELVRVYPEDGCTVPNENGELRAVDVEETEHTYKVEFGIGWQDAREVFDSVEYREAWAEGVVRNPRYKAIVVMEDDDMLDREILERVINTFALPVKTVRQSLQFNLD
jgi:hypothetical protein